MKHVWWTMLLHSCLARLLAGAHCLSLRCSESFIQIHSLQRIGDYGSALLHSHIAMLSNIGTEELKFMEYYFLGNNI